MPDFDLVIALDSKPLSMHLHGIGHGSGQADTGIEAATLFMEELLDSVESLTELGDLHGVRTLADLVYLQNAILKGSFIDHYPGESKVLEVVKALPSHARWIGFIELATD